MAASSEMLRNEDTGQYLFHYTTAEAFLAHILPSMRLRFSPYCEVNDPRESKEWLCSVTGELESPYGSDVLEISRQFTAALKGTAKVLCLTRDDPQLRPSLGNHYGRGYAHSRMWDRYAARHTGVCLVFHIDSLGDDVAAAVAHKGELIHAGVAYNDRPPMEPEAFNLRAASIMKLGLDGALRTHRQEHHGTLYFYKSTDWASEFEYRWVLLSDHADRYEFVDVRRSLAGVIFGSDYPEESIPMVRSVLSDRSVALTRFWYRNGHPFPLPVMP